MRAALARARVPVSVERPKGRGRKVLGARAHVSTQQPAGLRAAAGARRRCAPCDLLIVPRVLSPRSTRAAARPHAILGVATARRGGWAPDGRSSAARACAGRSGTCTAPTTALEARSHIARDHARRPQQRSKGDFTALVTMHAKRQPRRSRQGCRSCQTRRSAGVLAADTAVASGRRGAAAWWPAKIDSPGWHGRACSRRVVRVTRTHCSD